MFPSAKQQITSPSASSTSSSSQVILAQHGPNQLVWWQAASKDLTEVAATGKGPSSPVIAPCTMLLFLSQQVLEDLDCDFSWLMSFPYFSGFFGKSWLNLSVRWQCEAWIQKKNGLSTWCSMVGSNDLTPRVRAKMETMVHDVWHVKTSWTMDFTIVFHLKNTIYINIHSIIHFSLLNLNDFCMIPKTWTNHAASLRLSAVQLLFTFIQIANLSPLQTVKKRCKVATCNASPHHLRHKNQLKHIPCRIQVFVPVFETFELYMSRSNFKIREDQFSKEEYKTVPHIVPKTLRKESKTIKPPPKNVTPKCVTSEWNSCRHWRS